MAFNFVVAICDISLPKNASWSYAIGVIRVSILENTAVASYSPPSPASITT